MEQQQQDQVEQQQQDQEQQQQVQEHQQQDQEQQDKQHKQQQQATEEKEQQQLGDRMKAYERQYEDKPVPPDSPYLLRLDGKGFSKFTAGFRKPFDPVFTAAMVKTMNDMVSHFTARTGYTHSDEITLIFAKACGTDELDDPKHSVHMYNGRTHKICSIVSSFCAVRFNYHLVNLVANMGTTVYSQQFCEKVNRFEACFDCRIMTFPNDYEFVNHMIWRSARDCERNAIAEYGRYHFGHKRTFKKDGREIREMLKEEKGIDWIIDVPIYFRNGVYGKKELYTMEMTMDKAIATATATAQGSPVPITVTRSRIRNKGFRIHYSDAILATLLEKSWPDVVDGFELVNVDVNDDGTLTVA